ncbi:MAG: hypothetical protein HBSAPP04_01380 [Ignavibacteriaceae bacterium]|nr:MAG: hypothetical protein HBSAPP04_01380 [Ignavibacteriaceae bacterium]
MAKREYTDEEIVDLIKLLPVLLEIGEYKLYDTGSFEEYYPELQVGFYEKREDWNETFYYATENLLPPPDNVEYNRYLSEDIADFFIWSDNPEWKSGLLSSLNQTDRLREFYDDYEKIYDGILNYLEELDSRLHEYGAHYLSPVLLNLVDEGRNINVESMRTLKIMVCSGVFSPYSRSSTIKASREIRNAIYAEALEHENKPCYDCPVYEKLLPFDPSAADGFYDFLLAEYKKEFDTWEDQPEYNLKIIANILPSLFYDCLEKVTIENFENIFKPSTATLLRNLSSVNEDKIQEFVSKNGYTDEEKFLLVFLRTAFKWRRKLGEDTAKLIAEFFWLFTNGRADNNLDDYLLYPLMNEIGR